MIRIAVLGAGGIAKKMSETLVGMVRRNPSCLCMYAVASRDLEKARAMAEEYGYEKAYGSYEDMLGDKNVDLVYIATPHSHHLAHIKLCAAYGKHMLCEKSFTMNALQAREACELAEKKGLLLAEAIWTRYMPSRKAISDLLKDGVIGEPHCLIANLCYNIQDVERIRKPELAGGALLDVGVYPLNFASMVFGDEILSVESSVKMLPTGVDGEESVTLHYKDGKTAYLLSSACCYGDRQGVIMGETGYLKVDNINNPLQIIIQPNPRVNTPPTIINLPEQISGYEYEVEACLRAIEAGRTQCPEMPHAQTIRIMEQMDGLRRQWGMTYPGEA